MITNLNNDLALDFLYFFLADFHSLLLYIVFLNTSYLLFCAAIASTVIAFRLVPALRRPSTPCAVLMVWSFALLVTLGAKQESRNPW